RLWHWGWREEKFQAGGGWTLDGGVHFADQFRYHLGPIKTVSAVMRRFFPTRYRDRENLGDPVEVDVEDATIANLEFESGVIGQWAESNVAPGHPIGARVIYGSEGCIDFGQGLKTRVEELTLDELTAHLDPNAFERRLGTTLRCRLGGHKKILNHFGVESFKGPNLGGGLSFFNNNAIYSQVRESSNYIKNFITNSLSIFRSMKILNINSAVYHVMF
ncbi:MAG: hypothetical protein IIB13_04700, partial [Chloroflexi bacterium]|nr:hypothetical protein [Chloroflexota bacterium]